MHTGKGSGREDVRQEPGFLFAGSMQFGQALLCQATAFGKWPYLYIFSLLGVPVTLLKYKGQRKVEKPMEYLVDIIALTLETPAGTFLPQSQAKFSWLKGKE